MVSNYFSLVSTPLGPVTIAGDDACIHTVTFKEGVMEGKKENELTATAAAQLAAYFEGTLQTFDFPVAQPGTGFQKDVWERLTKIPYGKTCSYAEFSAYHPLAIRAIAAANGKNNIAIVVPCHRVIGSNGKLVGYAEGLWRKQWLLAHEKEIAQTGQVTLKF